MKITIKSIIKGGFLAVCLIFGLNSVATETIIQPVEIKPHEDLFMRALGIGLATIAIKYKKASNEFTNSFLYLSGLAFTNKAIQAIPNVPEDVINATDNATLAGVLLPVTKQALDLLKTTCHKKSAEIIKNLVRYAVACIASDLAQEAMVGGYGVLKTLIKNQ